MSSTEARRFRPSLLGGHGRYQVAHPGQAGERFGTGAAGGGEPSHLGQARVISAALALSPSSRPSTPPAASAITFFAAAHSSTPVRSVLT